VVDAADPSDGAFEAQPESRVDECAVLSQVEVPAVRIERETFL